MIIYYLHNLELCISYIIVIEIICYYDHIVFCPLTVKGLLIVNDF